MRPVFIPSAIVLVPGPGSGFFRRLPPPALDEAGPRAACASPSPSPSHALRSLSPGPLSAPKDPRLNLRHPEVHLDPSSNLRGTSDKPLPLAASVSLNLSSTSESSPSLAAIPWLWQGICDAGVCNPCWGKHGPWMMNPGPERVLGAGVGGPRPFSGSVSVEG